MGNEKRPLPGRIRAGAQKLRSLPPRQRIGHLFDYYKQGLLYLFLLILAVFLLYDAVTQSKKEIVLQGFFTNINESAFDTGPLEEEYSAYLGLSRKQRIIFDDSLFIDLDGAATQYTAASRGKILAYTAAKELDFVVTSRRVMDYYIGHIPVWDFEQLLPGDLLEKLKPSLYYAQEPRAQPVACALDLRHSRYAASQAPDTQGEALYLFVPASAPHPEALIRYIRYLTE